VLDPADAAQLGVDADSPVAFRAADLTITADPQSGNVRVVRSMPVAGGSQTAVGPCTELGGLPAGTHAEAQLARERCVPIG
jgi:hypothetical protein